MTLLLRAFRSGTQIFSVFHRYEPKVSRSKRAASRIIEGAHNRLVNRLTACMMRNADYILTMSRSSAEQIHSIFVVSAEKVTMVGIGIDRPAKYEPAAKKEEDEEIKDIDFLCIGRLEKFKG